jgi:putative membrane protein
MGRMRGFLVRLVISGIAIWVAALIVPGVQLGEAEFGEQLLTILVVALIFGVVNAVLGPVIRVVTLPLYLLTLGLFSLIVNALLLWLTGWMATQMGLAFSVVGFWGAVLGALVVSLVTVALGPTARGMR